MSVDLSIPRRYGPELTSVIEWDHCTQCVLYPTCQLRTISDHSNAPGSVAFNQPTDENLGRVRLSL